MAVELILSPNAGISPQYGWSDGAGVIYVARMDIADGNKILIQDQDGPAFLTLDIAQERVGLFTDSPAVHLDLTKDSPSDTLTIWINNTSNAMFASSKLKISSQGSSGFSVIQFDRQGDFTWLGASGDHQDDLVYSIGNGPNLDVAVRVSASTGKMSVGLQFAGLYVPDAQLNVGSDFATSGVAPGRVGFFEFGNTSSGFNLVGYKNRGDAGGADADVQSGDQLLQLYGAGWSDSGYVGCVSIIYQVAGSFTPGDAPPTAILFATNAGGGSTSTRFIINQNGVLVWNTAANETTGAGAALLGANCPAVTLTAPFKWLTVELSDGSTCFIPAWK